MKKKHIYHLVMLFVITISFTACIKNQVTPLKDEGETFLKLSEAPEYTIFFSPFADIRNVSLFTVGRDAANNQQLSSSATVKLTANNAAITAYNTARGTNYEVLPDSLYTLSGGITKSGNEYTIPLASGDFAKSFAIMLNGGKWDLSKRYAVAFSITDSSKMNIASGKKDILVFLSIKNAYDGVYSVVSGFVQRYTNPTTPEVGGTLNGSVAGNPDLTLSTVGPNTVEISGLQWAAGSNSGVAGINNLRATIDPATNQVTMFALGNATLTNWAGKDNTYDPVTKTFNLNFRWNPTSTVREYSIVIKYKRAR